MRTAAAHADPYATIELESSSPRPSTRTGVAPPASTRSSEQASSPNTEDPHNRPNHSIPVRYDQDPNIDE
jgi:hypothetical protein